MGDGGPGRQAAAEGPGTGPRTEGGVSRRLVLKGLGALAWTVPVVSTLEAGTAAASPVAPLYVTGSDATAFTGPGTSDKNITLTSSDVAVGDLWLVVVAYDERGTIADPAGAGWQNSTSFSGGNSIYSVEARVFWRILTAADISSGQVSWTFTATGADLTYGGFRGAAVAYRGTNLTADVVGSGVTQAGAIFVDTANVEFPALTPAPATPNVVLRLGALRGYGGWLAGSPTYWSSFPGTSRVNYNADNNGDRALVVSEQVNGDGAAASGSYFTASSGARHRATFTVAVRTGP